MMKFIYENQGTNTYLVYNVKPEDILDTSSLGMLTNNTIPGLASTLYTQKDNEKIIKYNVSTKVSAKQFFSGRVNKKRLLGVFSGIIEAMLASEDYMLDTNTILLDLDYIFTDVTTGETILICLPISNLENTGVDLGKFLKEIMFSIQFDSTENCDYVAKIINYLNSTLVFSLLDFKKIIDGIRNEVKVAVVAEKQPVVQKMSRQPATPVQMVKESIPEISVPQFSNSVPQQLVSEKEEKAVSDEKQISLLYLLQHYNKENAALYKTQREAKKNAKNKAKTKEKAKNTTQNPLFNVPGMENDVPMMSINEIPKEPERKMTHQESVMESMGQPKVEILQQKIITPIIRSSQADFGETVVPDEESESTVLLDSSEEQAFYAHLIRQKTNEKIEMKGSLLRIGREKDYADYCIADNPAIGRSHAYIIERNGEYFVVDTNSKNHTYVNEIRIQSNVEEKLMHGTSVRFANEEFIFYTH